MRAKIAALLVYILALAAFPVEAAPLLLKVHRAPSASQSMPLVAPSGSWTGTPGSGGTAPTDPTRTTAKPAASFWTIPFQNLSSNTPIGVTADANGGIAYVDFWVEGTVQRVTTPTLYTDIGGNGQPRSRWGYWINLNVAAANAAHANGGIDIYATVVPNDGTMQSRVIGGKTVNSTTLFDVDVRFQRQYNWTSTYDFSATLCPSGCAYTTLDAALTAIRAGGYTHPQVLCKTTGFYELNDRSSGVYYDAGLHWTTITADPGVTCTFGRSAAYNIANEASWLWRPQYDWLRFKGPGPEGNGNIIIDQHNFTQIETWANNPMWFDGVTVTNSSGTRDTFYFNYGGEQPIGPYYSSFWTDNTFNYMLSPFQYQRVVTGNVINQVFSELFSGSSLVAHNYVKDYVPDYFTCSGSPAVCKPLYKVTYTGPNTTVEITSNTGYPTTTTLNCNGVNKVYTNARYASQETGNTVFYLTTLKSKMEADCPGVTMTILEPGRSTYWWDTQATTTIKNVEVTITGHWEIHADWYHFYGSKENAIIINNVDLPPNNVFGMVNNQCTLCSDVIVKNNTWGDGFFGIYLGSNVFSHYVFANNTYSAATFIVPDTASDSYSLMYGNIGGQLSLSSGSTYPPSFNAHKNLWLTGGQPGPLTTYPDNFTPVASQSGFFVDNTSPAFNFTPTGTVATYTVTPTTPRDWRQLLRGTTDAIGAWVNGGSAPTYPF